MDQDKISDVISQLRACSARDDVERVFENNGIEDVQEKANLVEEAMYKPLIMHSTGMLPSEARYRRTVSILLTGAWKKYELYEKAYS